MVDREQVRPLAPAAIHPSSDADEAAFHLKKVRRRKFIKCCGCITAVILIQAVVIIILAFTVFRVKEPKIKMNKVTITRLELINNNTAPKPGSNMSLIADVSVKNPNFASFKYTNTTTTLYYHGVVVGEAHGAPGHAKARRTMRMNITVDMITDRLTSDPNLRADFNSGLMTMSSYSRIPGRVKLLNIIKKHVIVKMNCTMTVNISSQAIQEQKCKRKVKL
ncbi:late embryogenesis abundant protein At1g64065 [Pyrus communis]|uniref:late embryogenesis abundant protein At1g64065 n=1 Tax=Pyrus communis TaxID=23211 RepID=UPI0035C0D875